MRVVLSDVPNREVCCYITRCSHKIFKPLVFKRISLLMFSSHSLLIVMFTAGPCAFHIADALSLIYSYRAEELETALMEMVKQDNRRQLSARVYKKSCAQISSFISVTQFCLCEVLHASYSSSTLI